MVATSKCKHVTWVNDMFCLQRDMSPMDIADSYSSNGLFADHPHNSLSDPYANIGKHNSDY